MTTSSTIQRRLMSRRFREGFLGPAFDDRTYCPVAVPGVDFDASDASLTAPFTPAEVRDQVGYVSLHVRELDAAPGGPVSGLDGSGKPVTTVYVKSRLRFVIRVPGSADLKTTETYDERIRDLFVGLRMPYQGPPRFLLRQSPVQDPPLVWTDADDGDWRRRALDINIRREELRTLAGVQEVA